MSPFNFLVLQLTLIAFMIPYTLGREDVWIKVSCNKAFIPDDCDFNISNFLTIDDFDRCGPAKIPVNARNYFLNAAGRGITYKDNKDAFDRIKLKPKMLRDVTVNSIETVVMGQYVDFPIGLSPVALHKLAYPAGEKATIAGLSSIRTVMILSSFASTTIEEVAATSAAHGNTLHLWMQTYIFKNRSVTIDLVRRAERSGFKAIVLTTDSPIDGTIKCNARMTIQLTESIKSVNVDYFKDEYDASTNFQDITWLKSITNLPIIAKGILSGEDAIDAITAGASAILVSNHGGRQVDGDPASIDALPGVAEAVRSYNPSAEVYLDGGVRSGSDVYKAIALGAKMVFYGRPNIWGLAIGGAEGVRKVINTLKTEFNETMLLTGLTKVEDIGSHMLLKPLHSNSRTQKFLHPFDYVTSKFKPSVFEMFKSV